MKSALRALLRPFVRLFAFLAAPATGELHHELAKVQESLRAADAMLGQRGRQFDTLEIQNDQLLTMLTEVRSRLDERSRRFDTLEIQNDQALTKLTHIEGEAAEVRARLDSGTVAMTEGLAFVEHRMDQILAEAVGAQHGTNEHLDRLCLALDRVADRPGDWRHWFDAALDEDVPTGALLTERQANFLNRMQSHQGPSRQAGLWFNPPVSVRYRETGVEVGSVNERIVEVPFVYESVHPLPLGSTVLDVGAGESTVAFSLASRGYRVTALDLHPYPLQHRNLTAVASPLEEWDAPRASVDAVIFLSSIEHFGLGAYGEDGHTDGGQDRQALEHARELLVDGGLLVLTVPFGRWSVDEFQRVYDLEHLDALLEGWEVTRFELGRQVEPLQWEVLGGRERAEEVAEGSAPGVAMLTARKR